MKRGWQYFLLCSLLFILLSGTGCSLKRVQGPQKQGAAGSELFVNPHGGKLFNRSLFNKSRGTLINEKELFTGLRIYNLDNESAVTVCNVPGCLHLVDDKNCMANSLPFSMDNSVLWENHIVLPIVGNSGGSKLVYMNTDGTNQKVLETWADAYLSGVTSPVLIGNKAYFLFCVKREEMDIYGYVVPVEAWCELYEINMETAEIVKLYQTTPGRTVSAGYQMGYGDDSISFAYTLEKKNYLDIGLTAQEYFEQLHDLYNDPEFIKKLEQESHNVVYALKDFSFVFTPGIYGLIGKNGSGKSTMMNVLTGYLKYDTGQILVNDEAVNTRSRSYKELLGYMPQQQVLYDTMTVEQFLQYFAGLKGIDRRERTAMIDSLIAGINLCEKRRKRLGELSGGMKQRVLFAQALLGNPSIVLLDEPTAGVDPEERENLQQLIRTYCEGKIVILSTHILTDIEQLAKEQIKLQEGVMVKP